MTTTLPFQPPATLVEAKARLAAVIIEVQDIDAQLGNPDKRTAEGVRMSNIEWHQWRYSALAARRHRLKEVHQLKLWITARSTEAQEAGRSQLHGPAIGYRYRRCPHCDEKVAIALTETGDIGLVMTLEDAVERDSVVVAS